LASAERLASLGVAVEQIGRGGDVTLHAPGQLVGYPVVDLKRHRKDLHWYLRQVEEALIRAVAPFGVRGGRHAGYTGVWAGDGDPAGADWAPRRKMASIGVHARDWVTWHGFALNVSTDLSYFGLIVPCGIGGVDMTSAARETGRPVTVAQMEALAAAAFGRVFSLTPRVAPLEALALEAVPTTV
jgi:lipoate-protein ligase B